MNFQEVSTQRKFEGAILALQFRLIVYSNDMLTTQTIVTNYNMRSTCCRQSN